MDFPYSDCNCCEDYFSSSHSFYIMILGDCHDTLEKGNQRYYEDLDRND